MSVNENDPRWSHAIERAARRFVDRRKYGAFEAGRPSKYDIHSNAEIDELADQRLADVWQAAELARHDQRIIDMRAQARRRQDRRNRKSLIVWSGGITAIAASLCLAILPFRDEAVSIFSPPPSVAVSSRTYSTGIGEISTLTLTDGSGIVLDADSTLETRFDDTTRRIVLHHGRALFNVAHERRPFIVDGKQFSVRAVGTSFEVQNDENVQHLTILEGVVVATRLFGKQRAELRRGKSLTAVGSQGWKIANADLGQAASWVRGDLIFSNERISDIVKEVNRYSSRRLIVDDQVGRHRLSAVLKAGDPSALVSAIVSLDIAEKPSWNDRQIVIKEKR